MVRIDNRYEVVEELGRGGMGIVYKAIDSRLDRMVAIKVMTSHVPGDREHLERFEREAKSVAKLKHSSIVVVHDYGYHEGMPYISMEYVEGTPLDKIIASRTYLSMLVKVDYIVQVCSALHYAHESRLVHRDVKPANIMVVEGGQQVKLLDFGIARADGPSNFSKSGTAMGTTSYMSPEQTKGQKDLDRRSDIFCTGVVLYELLTGNVPWQGDSEYEIMHGIINDPFPPLSTRLGNYPAALDKILQRALAKDVNARYQTADEMAIELSGLEASLKEQALEDALAHFERKNLIRSNDLVAQILRIDTNYREAIDLRNKLHQVEQLQQRSEHARQLQKTAEQAVGRKQYQDALDAVEQAIALDSTNSELLQYRDLIRNELRRREDVRKKLELARRAQELNDLSSAQDLVDKALEVDPTDTQARTMKSLLQQEVKRQRLEELGAEASRAVALRLYDQAGKLIRQIEDLDPEFAPLPSLRKALLEAEAEEKRRTEIENLARDIRQALKSDVKQALQLSAQAVNRFPGEQLLIQLRAQAEEQHRITERERAIQEQLTAVDTLTKQGRLSDALSTAESAIEHLGRDRRLQTAITQLHESAERERTAHAQRAILSRAEEAMQKGDYEAAVRILSAGRVEFPSCKEIADSLQGARDAIARQAAEQRAEIERQRNIANALDKDLAEEADPQVQLVLAENAARSNPENERIQQIVHRVRARHQQILSVVERARNAERNQDFSEAIRQWKALRQVCPEYPHLDSQLTRLAAALESSRTPKISPASTPQPSIAEKHQQAPAAPARARISPAEAPAATGPEPRLLIRPDPPVNRLKLVVSGAVGLVVLAGIFVAYFLLKPGPKTAELVMQFNIAPAGTRVSVENQQCLTPCNLKLKPGRYTVRAAHDGYPSVEKEVVVGSQPETISFNLPLPHPSFGILEVRTNVDGVAVLIDGQRQDSTQGGKATISVPPGIHQISVEKTGFVGTSRPVELTADKTAKEEFVLAAAENKGQPLSDPYVTVKSLVGAQILVDGRYAGTVQANGTYTFKSSPGKHQIEVSLADHVPSTVSVDAKAGDNLRVDAELKEIPKPPAIIAFVPSTTEIQQGEPVDLRWQTQNATETIIEGIGAVQPANEGTTRVSPNTKTTYVLVAKGQGHEARSDPITINVIARLKPKISFFKPGTGIIPRGKSVTLFWATEHATEVSISPEPCSSQPSGNCDVSPTQTTIYTLTAKGPGGTDTSQTKVVVESPATIATAQPTPGVVQPVHPAEDPEIKAVKDTIEIRYREAYESMSMDELHKVWPIIPKEIEKAIRSFFSNENIRAVRLALSCGATSISGETALSTCKSSMSYTDDGKKHQEHEIIVIFQLKKKSGSWVVTSTAGK